MNIEHTLFRIDNFDEYFSSLANLYGWNESVLRSIKEMSVEYLGGTADGELWEFEVPGTRVCNHKWGVCKIENNIVKSFVNLSK